MKIFNNEKISEDRILEFLNGKLENKIGTNDFKSIIELIKKISQVQKIDLKEIEYLGKGQSYVTMALGDFAFKIGPELKMLKNPYQMLPIRMDSLKDSKQKIYTTLRCKTDNVKKKDVQSMYNRIRDFGGLWIDPKDDNLGFAEKNKNTESIKNYVDFLTINKNLGKNSNSCYITDFEDVIFLTPELIMENIDESKRWMTLPYGNLEGGTLYNKIFLDGVESIDNIEKIYEKNFIMRSQTLLKFEEKYQLQKGNKQLAQRYHERQKEIIKQIKQHRYLQKKYYKNKWSIKDIETCIMQKTRLSKLKEMIFYLKYKSKIKMENDKKLDDKNFVIQNNNEENKNVPNGDPFRTMDAR